MRKLRFRFASRHSVAVFLLLTSAVLVYAVASVWTLLSLLVVDGSADCIALDELADTQTPFSSTNASLHKELIPQIIHQTYINESIPAQWQLARHSCLELHTPEDGWEYKLWTDKLSREFVAAEYPWFLAAFDGYRYPIQRADAIRYLVLAHYGGIYIDLDDGCNRNLDPLRAYPAWLRQAVPTGISNDVMGSVPQHPFFLKAVDSLQRYNKNWFLPYITVMASTGPLFLSLIWRHYSTDLQYMPPPDAVAGDAVGVVRRVRLLLRSQYMGIESSFFSGYPGSSWHEADARLVFWMHDHWVLLVVLGSALAYLVFLYSWRAWRRLIR
ncbi:Glycosyltransferase, DXD sugar-binding motif protein [Pleurostoma richardsiae]|uniref:Glycosyltransferase, DXD sugar-binding motif protein n=1 Tax=Pleurostoma richardsiae TaxID=41990 RepID=A0AA38S6R7_9PEZI|nr:Glycosyltransferase, DXD sugar-binding motif protein [Pleurostoma richardsiae]